MTLSLEPVAPRHVIEECLDLVRPQADAPGGLSAEPRHGTATCTPTGSG